MGQAPDLTLRGVRVVDARGVVADRADVVVRGGRIVSVGGGSTSDGAVLELAPVEHTVLAHEGGVVAEVDALTVGLAASALGAGRRTKDDAVDHAVGICLQASVGDRVAAGDPLLTIFARDEAGVAAGMAPAEPVDDILAEIRAQGFELTRVQRTWLGRVRIIAQNASFRREVVIDPTTGEIRRDLLIPKSAPESQPDLGSSREIGPIGEEPGAEDPPAAPGEGEDDDTGWGGGWGSQGEPAEGAGAGDTNAQ